jgi:hypothetical protein
MKNGEQKFEGIFFVFLRGGGQNFWGDKYFVGGQHLLGVKRGVGGLGFLHAQTRERGPPLACASILAQNHALLTRSAEI